MTTSLHDDLTGITFRETMAGGFALGTDDPAMGAQSGTSLAMHAVVHIQDIDAFVADPQHRAGLTGTIDFAPLGQGLVADRGVFGLFSPSGDPALTYMVYELAFSHQGRPRYLAGKKHVQLGSPLRLWDETTTLYTTLHEGSDATGTVLGAGILTLGVVDLVKLLGTLEATDSDSPWESLTAKAKLLGTLEATDSDSPWESLTAKAKFMRFFGGELVRTYIEQQPDR